MNINYMFTVEEIRKIVNGHKFHWSVKCRIILNFHTEQKFISKEKKWTLNQTAYTLNYSKDFINESMRLAKRVQRYPNFANIHSRKEAIKLMNQFGTNINEFRKQVRMIATHSKQISKLDQAKESRYTIDDRVKAS